jgi:hypothetical protein
MKTLKNYLPLIVMGILTTSAFAVSAPGQGTDVDEGGAFKDAIDAINTMLGFIYWIIYLVAAVLITMAGFKLKNGEIPAFVKTMIGGMAVFGSKFLISALWGLINKD